MSKRLKKVSEGIKHELGDILLKETKDPNLSLVSISRVEVSPDLKHADVFFTSIKVEPQRVKKSLQKAEGMLKLELTKRIRLKYTPQLRFFEDKGAEYSLEISEILKKLGEKEEDID
jgi:ribosome-binding factor A